MNFADFYNDMVKLILENELMSQDALSLDHIEAAEQKLGLRLPEALREYYHVAGSLNEINREHNRLLRLEELEVEGDYLIFMEENQAVALWGVRTAGLTEDDPKVWVSWNQIPRQWFPENLESPEELNVSEFLHAMFVWTFGLDEGQESS